MQAARRLREEVAGRLCVVILSVLGLLVTMRRFVFPVAPRSSASSASVRGAGNYGEVRERESVG
jgi:hypothetical protein